MSRDDERAVRVHHAVGLVTRAAELGSNPEPKTPYITIYIFIMKLHSSLIQHIVYGGIHPDDAYIIEFFYTST